MTQPVVRLRSGYLILTLVLAMAFASFWATPANAAPVLQDPLPDNVLSIPLPTGLDTYNMSMAWDGKTLVVGAPWTDVGSNYSEGVVYIYSLDADLLDAGDPNPWSLDATIHMPDPQSGAHLGAAVAVEGDLIVAGAPGKDGHSWEGSGVALFIERTEENPAWHVTWVDENEPRQVVDMNQISMGTDAGFGSSIAIRDGRVMIGAPKADLIWVHPGVPDTRHNNVGGAWIFERNPPHYLRPWEVTKTFLQNPPEPNTGFGASVAISRVDALGVTYYAIGAPGTNAMPYSYIGRVHTIWQHDSTPENWSWHDVSRPNEFTESSRFGKKIALDGSFLAVNDERIGIGDGIYVENLLVHLDYLFLESPNPSGDHYFGHDFAMQNGVLVVGERGTSRADFPYWGTIHYVERIGDEWELTESLSPDGVAGAVMDDEGNYSTGAAGGWFGDSITMHNHWVLASAPFAGDNGMIHILDRRPPTPTAEPTPKPWLIPENIEPLIKPVSATNGADTAHAVLPLGSSAQIYAPIVLQSSGGTSDGYPTPLPTQSGPSPTPVSPTPSATPQGPTSTPVSPTPVAPTPTATPPGPTPTPGAGSNLTHILSNGSTARSLLGAGLTVSQGALDGSQLGYVLAVSQPVTPLTPYMQPLGNFFAVGVVTETVHSAIGADFIVRLPVPPGANVAKLGALVLLPEGTDHLHGENPGWIYAPGYYDSSRKEFSFALTLLPRGGAVVVLVTGETLHTLNGAGAAASAAASQVASGEEENAEGANAAVVAIFDVRCLGVAQTDPICDASLAAQVSSFFQQAHNRYQGQGFLPPRLQFAAPQVDGEGNPLPYNFLHYAATFITKGPCEFAGLYRIATKTIDICLDDPSINANVIGAINHELFHAVQFAYPNVLADRRAGKNVGFVIEGTASTAARTTATELLTDLNWPLRNVDKALNAPFVLNDLTTYSTQDFWVYTGRMLGQNLGYLRNIFNLGGEAGDVDVALGNNLEGAYWEWIKNQVLTKEVDPDLRFFFYPCELDPLITNTETVYIRDGGYVKKSVTLGPLTTRTYRIRADGDIHNPLQVRVERAGVETRFKIYEYDGSTNCVTDPDSISYEYGDGAYHDAQIIVVVSNANVRSAEYYELIISAEAGG